MGSMSKGGPVVAKQDSITCQSCGEKVPFIDFIEQRLKSDPVARKIAAFLCSAESERLTSFLAMDETATREPDTQALE